MANINGSEVDEEKPQTSQPSSTLLKRTIEGREYQQHVRVPALKARKQEDSLINALCVWIVDHQIGIAMNLLLLLALTHLCFPKARVKTRKFFRLSYYNPDTERYGIGWDDTSFVALWIVIFSALRILAMDYIMAPFAEWHGIHKAKAKTRFVEQAWIWLYAVVFWSLDMFIMYNEKYWMDLQYIWAGWPDREMDGLFKWYYLVQFAFWIQQIVVVNIEERRKDYSQMFTHHIVTCALMFTSYGYHHYRIGNVILCIMDSVDIALPLAKMLKYLKYQAACDIAFGVFVVLWFVARHIIYMLVVYSIYRDLPSHIQFGCYSGTNGNISGPFEPPEGWQYLLDPFINTEGLVCQTLTMQNMFVFLLLSLQVIILMWGVMIARVTIKVVRGLGAEDSRSDDEDEDEDEEAEADAEAQANVEAQAYVEAQVEEARSTKSQQMKDVQLHMNGAYIEVPVEDITAESFHRASGKSSPSHRYRRGHGGNASGVSLPHDRKELLGRIGCDKGT